MGKLKEKQFEFTKAVGLLILYAYQLGFTLSFGCARCAKEGHHIDNSYHYRGLAIDLSLFKNGIYLQNTEHHRQLGEFWESIGGTWGGRFNDGNHYSWGEGRGR